MSMRGNAVFPALALMCAANLAGYPSVGIRRNALPSLEEIGIKDDVRQAISVVYKSKNRPSPDDLPSLVSLSLKNLESTQVLLLDSAEPDYEVVVTDRGLKTAELKEEREERGKEPQPKPESPKREIQPFVIREDTLDGLRTELAKTTGF